MGGGAVFVRPAVVLFGVGVAVFAGDEVVAGDGSGRDYPHSEGSSVVLPETHPPPDEAVLLVDAGELVQRLPAFQQLPLHSII